MPQKLSEVTLDEVSLVDNPACPGARVVLMKRDDGADDVDVDKAAPPGIKFLIGFPKSGGGSEVTSVIFDLKNWDVEKAKAWLKAHNLTSEKVDETPNTLRFRQKDPAGYDKFRVIVPGASVAKALYAEDSWREIQETVAEAVREKFGKPCKDVNVPCARPWIRDFWKDTAVFDDPDDGQVYRVDYTVKTDAAGEQVVTLGDKVAVEVVYQDVKKSEEPAPSAPVVEKLPDIPEDLGRRVLKMRMDVLQARLQKGGECRTKPNQE